MNDNTLSGRTALVTGGSRGIGRAICVRLAEAGIKVAINYRSNQAAAEETAQRVAEAGSSAYAVRANVASREEVDAMVEEVSQHLGPIDLLVNNAGIFEFLPHDELTPEIWQTTLDTNLTAAYNTIWAVKDGMIERGFGRIVNMSSIGGVRGRPNSIAYSVTKAGIIMLTKSLAEAVAPHNLRVNCVAPGLTDTEMPHSVATPEVIEELIEATPLKRIGQPEDMAKVVYFLLSEDADFITGQTISVSGGLSMQG